MYGKVYQAEVVTPVTSNDQSHGSSATCCTTSSTRAARHGNGVKMWWTRWRTSGARVVVGPVVAGDGERNIFDCVAFVTTKDLNAERVLQIQFQLVQFSQLFTICR